MSDTEKLTEGWGYIAPGTKVAHYYRDTESLCRKRGWYMSDLFPDDGKPSHNECSACRKVLQREAAKKAKAATGTAAQEPREGQGL